jgi:hypothetical protein
VCGGFDDVGCDERPTAVEAGTVASINRDGRYERKRPGGWLAPDDGAGGTGGYHHHGQRDGDRHYGQ